MTQYRDHHRLLTESMDTLVEVTSRADLVERLEKSWPFSVVPGYDLSKITILPYDTRGDDRIGWKEVWIVFLGGFGVLGFTDGPLT